MEKIVQYQKLMHALECLEEALDIQGNTSQAVCKYLTDAKKITTELSYDNYIENTVSCFVSLLKKNQ